MPPLFQSTNKHLPSNLFPLATEVKILYLSWNSWRMGVYSFWMTAKEAEIPSSDHLRAVTDRPLLQDIPGFIWSKLIYNPLQLTIFKTVMKAILKRPHSTMSCIDLIPPPSNCIFIFKFHSSFPH